MEQLNIKAKNFRDLLTDEPFSRQDIITLQVGVPGAAPPTSMSRQCVLRTLSKHRTCGVALSGLVRKSGDLDSSGLGPF